MRNSDWSSDVCSSDLQHTVNHSCHRGPYSKTAYFIGVEVFQSGCKASAYGHLDTVIGLVNWIGQLINITCSCQQTKAQQVLVKIKITVIGGSVKGFYIKFFGQKCQVQQAAGERK